VIGGEYFFDTNKAVSDNLSDSLIDSNVNLEYFGSGRDSFYTLLKHLGIEHIFLPDLICESMYKVVTSLGIDYTIYKIDENLKVDSSIFRVDGANSCVLFIHHFGILDKDAIKAAGDTGLCIISDATHLLFNKELCSKVALLSDYVFGSLRKSGPFPDGGFIGSRKNQAPRAKASYRKEFVAYRVAGLYARGIAFNNDWVDDENFQMLKFAEDIIDSTVAGSFSCSSVTLNLIRTISLNQKSSHIKSNFKYLSDELAHFVDCLNVGGAPSPYFVILFENSVVRNKVRVNLSSKEVFCPIHWDTSFLNDPSILSSVILSIPVDDRYGLQDMKFIVETIKCAYPLF
jgi:hypothetical protein